MAQPIIEVEKLSKRYRLGQFNARTMREEAENLFRRLSGKANETPAETDFWALRDVSFTVQPGEVVGIIGRNGAGKSTLLKILSRVTEPTSGQAHIRGRVASLLEVGTGFHPELTGRENIYLNGAILGMSRTEIKGKFDEIVDFAEIERFLDTPVKRYSSGMYVRLAFAVAAHLDPEILIVDEVLAVGDYEFQEKCVGKMRQVKEKLGRTVLFVSHNMAAVQMLCDEAFVLDEGRLVFRGTSDDAVKIYRQTDSLHPEVHDSHKWSRTGTGDARIVSVRFEDDAGEPQSHFQMGEPLSIVVRAVFHSPTRNPIFGVIIATDGGVLVTDCRSSHYDVRTGVVEGTIEYRVRIASVQLYPRSYEIQPWITDAGGSSILDWVKNAAEFVVTANLAFVLDTRMSGKHGIVYIPTSWTVDRIAPTSSENNSQSPQSRLASNS